MNCPFCNISNPIIENEHWYGIFDNYPVSKGHFLLISKEHRIDYFECLEIEKMSLTSIIDRAKDLLIENFKPDGFNIGINVGAAAGQSIFHMHVHVIPRFEGDVENPRGGVRGVIPSKQNYDG